MTIKQPNGKNTRQTGKIYKLMQQSLISFVDVSKYLSLFF